ncbi:MAG: hypothetical protein ACPW61_04530 [Methyloligella sp. ZOD6]
MINVYLFIELLGAANPATAMDELNALKMEECRFANVVKLSDEKLVAQLDCETSDARKRPSSATSPRSRAWFRPTSSPRCGRGTGRGSLMVRDAHCVSPHHEENR